MIFFGKFGESARAKCSKFISGQKNTFGIYSFTHTNLSFLDTEQSDEWYTMMLIILLCQKMKLFTWGKND